MINYEIFFIPLCHSLAGKCHRVFTGVVLKHSKGVQSFTESADVYFGNLTIPQINAYIETGESM